MQFKIKGITFPEMVLSRSIQSSRNALVIDLNQARIEDIVEEKLRHYLSQKPLDWDILKNFYEPVEQALIEFTLGKKRGNQIKTAKVLGINRNTLKKKIVSYRLNITELLTQSKSLSQSENNIFLSSADSLNLLSACRAKLAVKSFQDQMPKESLLKRICHPVESTIIKVVLNYCKGNQIRASRLLGINRNTLRKKTNLKNYKSKVQVH